MMSSKTVSKTSNGGKKANMMSLMSCDLFLSINSDIWFCLCCCALKIQDVKSQTEFRSRTITEDAVKVLCWTCLLKKQTNQQTVGLLDLNQNKICLWFYTRSLSSWWIKVISLEMLLTSRLVYLWWERRHVETRDILGFRDEASAQPPLHAGPSAVWLHSSHLGGEMKDSPEFRRLELPFWSYITPPPPLFPHKLFGIFFYRLPRFPQARRAPASFFIRFMLFVFSNLTPPLPSSQPPHTSIPQLFCHSVFLPPASFQLYLFCI